ncbi:MULTISPECIES: TIGR03086 family metal-binding protein [Streptomyces]|nr:TIGR03086 family metal-binding protein [Streptomyces nigrescens]MEE4417794.1 TIGR03086 family metal-binding protein [Streptomyces sp. DSM 41528]
MRETDNELFTLLTTAYADCAARIRLVRSDQWTDGTPCEKWDVRQLVGHLVQGNLIYTALMHGGSADGFLTQLDQDPLGDHPLADYERASAAMLTEFRVPGALDRTVDYPFAPLTARQLLGLMITDTLTHTWDLSRAIGADDQLDGHLVDWVMGNVDWIYAGVEESPLAQTRSDLYYGEPVPSPPSGPDSPQDRLLRLMGRRP